MGTGLIVLGVVLSIIGIIGCILPGLPGTIFNYLGLLCVHFSDKTESIPLSLLIGLGIATALAMGVEYIMPMIGAKQFGGSKYGAIGAVIGLIVGLFFMPFGIIIGPLVGATLAEMATQKQLQEALKAGIGAVIGVFFSAVAKLLVASIITVYVVKNIL